MAGIYIHIPFCKTQCNYCDFYKTSNLSLTNELVAALRQELPQRKGFLNDKKIETIYFGGGTPSILKVEQLELIISDIKQVFEVSSDAEITIEANPDDLNINYLKQLVKTSVNRLSIGIQSFIPEHLVFMSRRHSKEQAISAVKNAQKVGFNNISIDLIYGLPQLSNAQWLQNLEQAFQLNVQHVSAYHLTYHEGTSLYNDLKKGKIKELDENISTDQFQSLTSMAKENDFVQYEISNFAKNMQISKHNSSYWKLKEYLGIGPSAHSFNQIQRSWNIANTKKYVELVEQNSVYFETETLSLEDQFNDYLITSLRTIWGVDLQFVESKFGKEVLQQLIKEAKNYISSGDLIEKERYLYLTQKGKFISDAILTALIQMN